MSESNILLNQLWSTLSDALNGVFDLKPMTRDAYMSHYSSVHSYFSGNEYNDNLLKESAKKPNPPNQPEKMESNQDEIIPPGGQLYFNVKRLFKHHLENIAANGNNLQSERFLQFYAKTWESYQFSSQIADGILGVLNQNWVGRQHSNGVKGISNVYIMAMEIWQDVFFKESNQSLIQTCLRLINEERNGRSVDSSLIRQVVQSYVKAGFIKFQTNNTRVQTIDESLTTYRKYFEQPFLQETEQFYKLESNEFFAKNSINDYIKKVYQRFAEEEDRVKNVLHPTTFGALQSLLVRVLIQNQLEPMYVEAKKLLRDEKIEDLRMLFELINRINKADEPIQKDLETYAYQIGMDEISAKKETAIKEPKVYVETIIEVYEKFSKIVTQSFCNSQGYTVALDKAFSKLINDNAVTREANRSSKSPELLARYCDALLRKGFIPYQ
jgi:cullin 1